MNSTLEYIIYFKDESSVKVLGSDQLITDAQIFRFVPVLIDDKEIFVNVDFIQYIAISAE